MVRLNPYLTFNGNCEEAFNFYKSVFGKEFQYVGRFKDMPQSELSSIPASAREGIMHISLPISNEVFLMGSDNNPSMGQVQSGQNVSLSLAVDSKEEADSIFSKLSAGANVTMPMANTFWNAYFGMLTDRFGISWMINYDLPVSEHQKVTETAGANI
jgi:PhnB protein